MQFDLTEDQQLLQRTVRDFAREKVAPTAAENDRLHRYPEAIVREMAEMGLLGVAVPEVFGGAGMDAVAYVVSLEEISAACASTGVIMSVNNSLVCDPLLQFGDEAQKQEFLVPLAQGEKLGCFALSEPEAGSDAAAQRTVARDGGDHWVINGAKNFITNAHEADICVLIAMTDPEQGHDGISAFVVPLRDGVDGVRLGSKEDKLGIRASSTSQIFFEDCRLPKEALLGEVGGGFKVAMATLDGGRIGIAAQAVGIARAALKKALAYAGERETFGQPIVGHQAIQFKLADMAVKLDAARLLTYRAARLKAQGVRHTQAAAMAKLFASEAANFVANEAIQIHGGYGYLSEYEVERLWRDARITEIYEGTSEIQRMVIASTVLREG